MLAMDLEKLLSLFRNGLYFVCSPGLLSLPASPGDRLRGTTTSSEELLSAVRMMWGQCSNVFTKKGFVTPRITCGLSQKAKSHNGCQLEVDVDLVVPPRNVATLAARA